MDERDVRLLKAIEDLETGSPDALHEATDIPLSTIHYRLNNLREDGVIENDVYDIDLDEVGLGVTVVLEVLTEYSGSYRGVLDDIEAVEGVTQVFFTMGETDFLVVARLPDSDDVERLITDFEAIDAVDRTNSTFVIARGKDTTHPLQTYSEETLVDELVDED
ncbi:Lrp/AsnC family transcriptional regulator [Halocalculus aciditolerans]|uniref:Transcriptional regulator n=1 Tax=Halocalculus aciditolerans TaxID=1383812 RepID=A0A830F2D3_9EURY|nr:Lrp/AsnC family transcriptional regulator [Halocalculus aciditolerans]GGL55698.1 transcriptional regulator [Halocalculus aciditolerans]